MSDEDLQIRQVWKFPLALRYQQAVSMPRGARILTVQMQEEALCLWALCNIQSEPRSRVIAILATGESAPGMCDLKYISSFQQRGGEYVFHAFEIVDAEP